MLSIANAGTTSTLTGKYSQALAIGLHDAAQPLTVVQGTLELALFDASTVEGCKRAIEQSLVELYRVIHCFEHLRSIAQSSKVASPGANNDSQAGDSEVAHV